MHKDEIRFWAQVKRCRHGQTCKRCCWEWQGGGSDGYGQASWGGKSIPAYRLSLILAHGAGVLGRQFIAMHLCHNPPCVNPSHLAFGTAQDNSRDRFRVNHWYEVLRSLRAPLRRDTALGAFVRCERAKRFLFPDDFAQALGLPPWHIRQMEEGMYKRVDLAPRCIQLAQALGISPAMVPAPDPYDVAGQWCMGDIRHLVDPILKVVITKKQWAVVQKWQAREAQWEEKYGELLSDYCPPPSKYCPLQ